jgi:hypothetical protein
MKRVVAAGILVTVLLACLGLWIASRRRGNSKSVEDHSRSIEDRYRFVKGKKVGLYLAEKFAGKRVLVMLPADAPMFPGPVPDVLPHELVWQGLKEGMAGKLTVAGEVKARRPAGAMAKLQKALERSLSPAHTDKIPDSMWWLDGVAMNRDLARHKGEYDLLVCLTDLPGVIPMPCGDGEEPVSVAKLDIWKDDAVRVVFVEGRVAKLGPLIQSGKIAAVATYKSGPSDTPCGRPPASLDEKFDQRFVLITSENLQEYTRYLQK